LILTGCRLAEIQTMKWSYVQGGLLNLPDSKTGAKKVYLAPVALDVLRDIERQPENDYVITGKIPGKYLTDLQHPWRRIRARARLDDVRIHDLRHSFASRALARGEGLPMIGKLLGHKTVQSTARYAHLADDPVHLAALNVSADLARDLDAGTLKRLASAVAA
jgi:integrase